MDPRPPTHGGARPKPPGELRSPFLRRVGHAVGDAAAARLHERWPDLTVRYGERGRAFTREDNDWHLNFLDAAVFLDDPGHFDRYADWLTGFMTTRGMGPEHVAGAFRFLADGLGAAPCPEEWLDQRRRMLAILDGTCRRIEASIATAPDP